MFLWSHFDEAFSCIFYPWIIYIYQLRSQTRQRDKKEARQIISNAALQSTNALATIQDVDQRLITEVDFQAVRPKIRKNAQTSAKKDIKWSKSDHQDPQDDGDDEEFEIAVAISRADAEENKNKRIEPDEMKGLLPNAQFVS